MLGSMHRRCLHVVAVAAFAVASWSTATAGELNGIKMPDTATVGGQALVLNGMGLRKRAIFKVYVAGLYVGAKSHDGAALLATSGSKRIAFGLKRDVGADTFAKALNEGVVERSTPEQLTALRERLAKFEEIILSVKEVKEDDSVLLDYVPGTGTTITYNGKTIGQPIAGEDFFRAVLNIFIGPKPVQDGLKEGMLGAQ
jgi:hypothetical protein